ncbi:hypothetical protein SBI67_16350 [Mycolicibacterium sp. 120266]|uniref:hypothetical protein n=1 Tax=Mycolicibacterium sp. 120266 TaxID=3090601 RepID=UPI00299DB2AC|nr:hypothetical protein [Mycolicibacterium sp. 120266]MDX1873690.1 hypothetical protein [Mycolicibacterium sp. 120266]
MTAVEHLNRRLLVALPDDFESARLRYETLVPAVDLPAFGKTSNWDDVLAEAKAQAPHGFCGITGVT